MIETEIQKEIERLGQGPTGTPVGREPLQVSVSPHLPGDQDPFVVLFWDSRYLAWKMRASKALSLLRSIRPGEWDQVRATIQSAYDAERLRHQPGEQALR